MKNNYTNCDLTAAIELMREKSFMSRNKQRSPREVDPKELWAHLKVKYKDGDEMVDDQGLIWDVWKKGEGYVLYNVTNKEVIEVPKPDLGG